MLVSELARRDVTVALSGDGGDELFLGYNRYVWVPAIWRRIGALPVGGSPGRGGDARRGVSRRRGGTGRAASCPQRDGPGCSASRWRRSLGIADAADPEEVFHRLVSHWQDPSALVRGIDRAAHDPHRSGPVAERPSGIVEHMAAIDAVTYLPDDILTKVDRATMSVSLEGRIPLLDREIVEFAAGLPVGHASCATGVSKWPLRQVLGRSVPRELFERPKSGFGVPIEDWLAGPLRDWAEYHLRGSGRPASTSTRRWSQPHGTSNGAGSATGPTSCGTC